MGYVYPTKTIHISHEKLSFPMPFRLKIFSDTTIIDKFLKGIKDKIELIAQIPGIKDQTELLNETTKQIAQSTVTLETIGKITKTILKYRGEKVKEPVTTCGTELAHNLDIYLFAAEGFIKTNLVALDTTYTASAIIPGAPAYSDIVNVLQDTYIHLRNIEDKANEYLEKLESLTSGQISPAIFSAVQLSTCVAEGELDKIKLQGCEKTTAGLLCQLMVEIYSKSNSYVAYTPVNYNGVEIHLPENKILVKSNDEEHGLLICDDEDLEMMNDCQFSAWQPTSDIFSADPAGSVEKLNFTLADPPLAKIIMDGSVLIMDKRAKISTTLNNGEDKEIPNVSPMAISFGKTSTLTISIGQTKSKFKGGTLETGVEVITSLFNVSTIASMHEKALKGALIDMNWTQILKYASLVIQVAVLPVAFTTCTISVYAIVKAILRRKRRNRRDKLTRKYALRRNYELNKRVSKKARKSDT